MVDNTKNCICAFINNAKIYRSLEKFNNTYLNKIARK